MINTSELSDSATLFTAKRGERTVSGIMIQKTYVDFFRALFYFLPRHC
jgi:hypothetical protein